jgi:biopolymer transport protein ExbD
MSFLPEDAVKSRDGIPLAPMIDFLFLMLMFVACVAVSRLSTRETDIELVSLHPENAVMPHASGPQRQKILQITINAAGEYHWMAEGMAQPMADATRIALELNQHYEAHLLPEDKAQTLVLLKIDKQAMWEPIMRAIFAIRDAGFQVKPVYEPLEAP